jgi:putative oxidoreductase
MGMTPETLMLIGRVAFGGFFLIAAIRNFANLKERFAMAITSYGWVLPPPLVVIGFVMQLVGGLSVMFGVWTVWGALLLIAFTVMATAMFHNLFMFQGKERDPHLYLTLVNITLCSGLLMVIAGAM